MNKHRSIRETGVIQAVRGTGHRNSDDWASNFDANGKENKHLRLGGMPSGGYICTQAPDVSPNKQDVTPEGS